jgi:hypothetical protein
MTTAQQTRKRVVAAPHIHHGAGWIAITVPVQAHSLNQRSGHTHAERRIAREQKAVVKTTLVAYLGIQWPWTTVIDSIGLIRRASSFTLLDKVNLYGSLKHVQDGVCEFLGIDDAEHKPGAMKWEEFKQERSKDWAVDVVFNLRGLP